jgi:hypothetical protein
MRTILRGLPTGEAYSEDRKVAQYFTMSLRSPAVMPWFRRIATQSLQFPDHENNVNSTRLQTKSNAT